MKGSAVRKLVKDNQPQEYIIGLLQDIKNKVDYPPTNIVTSYNSPHPAYLQSTTPFNAGAVIDQAGLANPFGTTIVQTSSFPLNNDGAVFSIGNSHLAPQIAIPTSSSNKVNTVSQFNVNEKSKKK